MEHTENALLSFKTQQKEAYERLEEARSTLHHEVMALSEQFETWGQAGEGALGRKPATVPRLPRPM